MTRRYPLTRVYVESIHDELIAMYWGFDEPVRADEHRNMALLESAVSRPFQRALGRPVHWTIFAKAAALFHSLISNHPFTNGNKRTAVIAVDQFFIVNGYFLLLQPEEMYLLARQTARHNEDGIPASEMLRRITEQFHASAISLNEIQGSRQMDILRNQLTKLGREIRKRLRQGTDVSSQRTLF